MNHSRKRITWCLAIGIVASVGLRDIVAADKTATAKRPNILFILADDLAPQMTGFAGHKYVKTPHLDKLAAESTRFTRAYATSPQDAPSRASILTGQYPHAHGVTTDGKPLPLNADTFTDRLARAGYACGIVGKWSLPSESAAKPGFGFADYVATDDDKWSWERSPVWIDGERKTADKFLTDYQGDRAIEFIERVGGKKPFFLWLCFQSPSEPLAYPPGTEGLYPPKSMDLPRTMNVDVRKLSSRLRSAEPIKEFSKNKAKLGEDRSKYYAMITRMDENIGRVLDRLDAMGLADDTIVVFASDQGWALGEHGLYSTGPFFYEELIRVPLLVRYPKVTGAGMTLDRVVSLVDLAPTFCELVGLKPTVVMQGQSLLPIIREPTTARHADECFVEYETQLNQQYPARGIVTDQYKLIDYQQGPDRDDVFYDLKRDSNEMNNAVEEKAYASVIQALRSRIDKWRRRTGDPTRK